MYFCDVYIERLRFFVPDCHRKKTIFPSLGSQCSKLTIINWALTALLCPHRASCCSVEMHTDGRTALPPMGTMGFLLMNDLIMAEITTVLGTR